MNINRKTRSKMVYTAVDNYSIANETKEEIDKLQYYHKETWGVSYFADASGTAVICGEPMTFAAGDVFLTAPFVPHCWNVRQSADSKSGMVCLDVNGDFVRRCADFMSSFSSVSCSFEDLCSKAVKFDKATSARIADIMGQMAGQAGVLLAPDVLKVLLCIAGGSADVSVERASESPTADETMDRVKSYVKLNAGRNISLDEVSQYVGMSKSSSCAFFKRRQGVSFVTYLDGYRIDMACEILAMDGAKPVSDICFETGFNSVPYFNRVFRKFKNLSPSEFRALAVLARQ